MNKLISFAILACGITLLIYGVITSDSIGAGFSRFFSGAPTDKTIWLFLGGVAATLIGITGLVRKSSP